MPPPSGIRTHNPSRQAATDLRLGSSATGTGTFISRNRKFTALKVTRKCPLVLLVKVGWKQGTSLGSEGSMAEGECRHYAPEGRSRLFGVRFVFFGGQHCDKIFIKFGGLRLGENFQVNVRNARMSSTECNVAFGCQTCI